MISRDDLLHLALEVTGLDEGRWTALFDALKDDATMNRIMREDWERFPRDSERAIRDYYRESHIWFVNTWNHGVGALLEMAGSGQPAQLRPWQRVFIEDFKIQRWILDYGGGFFNDTYSLVMLGHKVSVAEVKGPVTEYLRKYRTLAQLENRIDVVEVDGDSPLFDNYGGVVCFETLEHVLDPVRMAAHFYEHMNREAPFAFSVSFGNPSHAPYHVASNAPLGDPRVWASKLEGIGFRPHWEGDDRHMKIWKRS